MLRLLSAAVLDDDRSAEPEVANQVGMPQTEESQWESAPLVGEDREVFFACRTAWLEDSSDVEVDFKEDDYDTTKTEPKDVFPYLVTMGYRDEERRKQVSLAQILRIKELRKIYNVPRLSEKP